MPLTGVFSSSTITSRSSKPARAAGRPVPLRPARRPCRSSNQSSRTARRGRSISCPPIPDEAPAHLFPHFMSCMATRWAVSMAMAKQSSLGRADGGRIDPHDLPPSVHQGPAGISRVQGRVGLDDVVNEPARLGTKRPAKRGYHARGDGGLEAQGASNGHHQLTDPQILSRS